MLEINKEDVDFLVTKNMVSEVKKVLEVDAPIIKKLVKKMIKDGVKQIYFVACGSCLCACQTTQKLVEQYSNIRCQSFSGFDFLDSVPYKLDNECVVIGVSDSGNTQEVIDALKLSRDNGAFTIGVTKKKDGNKISDAVDVLIDYQGECIWEMHLLVTYLIALYFMIEVEGNNDLIPILNDLNKIPDILERLVEECEDEGRRLGEHASKWDFVYTVAGGMLDPLAYKEGIITLMEFTWTHGCKLSSSEFRHGPLEIVEEGIHFVFYLGTDQSRETTQRVINFVSKLTDEYIVFDILDYEKEIHPMLVPFILFVPLEYFYYYLSIYKDHNPDNRRYYGGLLPF